jgi:hypothetical protein
MGPIRIRFLPFFVDFFLLWVMFTCAVICLALLMDGFMFLIFIYMVFLLFHYENAKMILDSPKVE